MDGILFSIAGFIATSSGLMVMKKPEYILLMIGL